MEKTSAISGSSVRLLQAFAEAAKQGSFARAAREPAHVWNDGEALVAAACMGLGLAQVPDLIAADAVDAGKLEEVLAAYRPTPMPISVVFATRRHMPMRLRAFIDAATARAG